MKPMRLLLILLILLPLLPVSSAVSQCYPMSTQSTKAIQKAWERRETAMARANAAYQKAIAKARERDKAPVDHHADLQQRQWMRQR